MYNYTFLKSQLKYPDSTTLFHESPGIHSLLSLANRSDTKNVDESKQLTPSG